MSKKKKFKKPSNKGFKFVLWSALISFGVCLYTNISVAYNKDHYEQIAFYNAVAANLAKISNETGNVAAAVINQSPIEHIAVPTMSINNVEALLNSTSTEIIVDSNNGEFIQRYYATSERTKRLLQSTEVSLTPESFRQIPKRGYLFHEDKWTVSLEQFAQFRNGDIEWMKGIGVDPPRSDENLEFMAFTDQEIRKDFDRRMSRIRALVPTTQMLMVLSSIVMLGIGIVTIVPAARMESQKRWALWKQSKTPIPMTPPTVEVDTVRLIEFIDNTPTTNTTASLKPPEYWKCGKAQTALENLFKKVPRTDSSAVKEKVATADGFTVIARWEALCGDYAMAHKYYQMAIQAMQEIV